MVLCRGYGNKFDCGVLGKVGSFLGLTAAENFWVLW